MIRTISSLAVADLAAIAIANSQNGTLAGWFVPVHICLTLLALLVWFRHRMANAAYDIPVLALGAAFGPCGMVVFAVAKPWEWAVKRTRWLASSADMPSRQSARQSETPVRTLARVLDGRIYFPEANRVESLNTTLRFGGLMARRKALEAIVRSFEPKLSPLIAIALTDRDQTIRALAAAASAQISSDVTQKIAEIDGKHAQQATPNELFALALTLAEHGCHNVLLPRTQRSYLCRTSGRHLAGAQQNLTLDDKRSSQLSTALREIRRQVPRFETVATPVRLAGMPEVPA